MEVTENKLNFLRLKLHNEKEFIRGYYKLSKQQIRYLFSDILHKPYNKCYLKDLNYEEICICFNVLRAMVLAARNGQGRRIPKTITKYKQYGEQIRKEQNNV